MALNIDLDNDDAAEMERAEKAGGLIPHIFVRAFLHDAIDETSAGDSPLSKLTFEIAEGQYQGRKVKADLFHEGQDAEGTKKAQLKIRRFGKRLGVMEKYAKPDGTEGHRYCEGMAGFEDAIGNECVIEVVEQRRKNKQTGMFEASGFNEVGYMGIWTPEEFAALEKEKAEKAATPRGKKASTPATPASSTNGNGHATGTSAARQTQAAGVNYDGL